MNFSANTIANEFKELAGGDYQTALLYAALTGAVVGDILPTPATAWSYYRMKVLQKRKEDGSITQKELEEGIAQAYSIALPMWWIAVFGIIHFHKGSFEDKAKLALMLVGGGAVVGALFKNHVKHLPKYETT
jgi:hypothetical protein